MDLVKLLGKNTNKLLKNDTTKIVLTLVLALYSALAAPALPNKVVTFFDSMLGKLLFLFLIGYMASKDIQVALMIAVAFVVTLHVANKRVTENYINNVLKVAGPGKPTLTGKFTPILSRKTSHFIKGSD